MNDFVGTPVALPVHARVFARRVCGAAARVLVGRLDVVYEATLLRRVPCPLGVGRLHLAVEAQAQKQGSN